MGLAVGERAYFWTTRVVAWAIDLCWHESHSWIPYRSFTKIENDLSSVLAGVLFVTTLFVTKYLTPDVPDESHIVVVVVVLLEANDPVPSVSGLPDAGDRISVITQSLVEISSELSVSSQSDQSTT
jgi:hypothetical protein